LTVAFIVTVPLTCGEELLAITTMLAGDPAKVTEVLLLRLELDTDTAYTPAIDWLKLYIAVPLVFVVFANTLWITFALFFTTKLMLVPFMPSALPDGSVSCADAVT